MSNFINGWQYPSFKIYGESERGRISFVKKIDLAQTDSSGLVESIEELKVQHELLDYSFIEKIFGYRITWTFSYAVLANKDTMLKIQEILQYCKAGYKIVLIPRADLQSRFFEVIYSGDKLEMGIKKGGSRAVGNRLVTIQFTTKYLVEDIGWLDPDKIPHAAWRKHNYFCVKV